MKIDAELTQAQRAGPRRQGERGYYSYRQKGQWFVVSYGPGYTNTFKVNGFDTEGLQRLELIERKG